MKKAKHGNPIHLANGSSTILKEVINLSEKKIQNLIFKHPSCLPISDIDESFNPIIPICKELWTPAGPLDILMITPNGDLVIIETKLWKNPEARRKVIAQILDYAKEISKWSYSDLQREINKKLGLKGNSLYELAANFDSNLVASEIDFVDSISRNLRLGKFLLIIAGDGIREGAREITEFLQRFGNLNFALAMVELSIFRLDENDLLIFPRVPVKTVEIQKVNIELAEGMEIVQVKDQLIDADSTDVVSPEILKRRDFFTKFWAEFISKISLDDPAQSMPIPSIRQNIYIFPGKDKNSWISAYCAQSSAQVGVYFKFANNNIGSSLKDQLDIYKEDIKKELGPKVIWQWENNQTDGFAIRLSVKDVYHEKNREKMMNFFSKWMNTFVNIIRPRLKQIE